MGEESSRYELSYMTSTLFFLKSKYTLLFFTSHMSSFIPLLFHSSFLYFFRCKTRNEEECKSYGRIKFLRRFSDVTPWIRDCDLGIFRIGEVHLEPALLIFDTMWDICMVNPLMSKSIRIQDNYFESGN